MASVGVGRAVFSCRLLALAAMAWLWRIPSVEPANAPQPCQVMRAGCIYDQLNLSSDGLQRLKASSTQMPGVFTVKVIRLISPFADGVLLLLLGDYFRELYYEQYRERIFRIPPGSTLEKVSIENAPSLQTISVASPNDQLEAISLLRTGMRTLPGSFANLRALSSLVIQESALVSLHLDPLGRSEKLRGIVLHQNELTQLVVSNDPELSVAATDLSLIDNRIEFVDGAFFTPLRELVYVSLAGNRLQRFEGTMANFPRLVYLDLQGNALVELDASGWTAPRLQSLTLDRNNLTRVPAGLERLPNLTGLMLSYNQLTFLELRRLERWPRLEQIDVSYNDLRAVRASGPDRISLPRLTALNLAFNRITVAEFGRWDLPRLSSLTLLFNQLQRLPDLFQLFPKLGRVLAQRNPFRCANLRQLSSYIAAFRLTVDASGFGMPPCSSNGSFTLPTGVIVCCVE